MVPFLSSGVVHCSCTELVDDVATVTLRGDPDAVNDEENYIRSGI